MKFVLIVRAVPVRLHLRAANHPPDKRIVPCMRGALAGCKIQMAFPVMSRAECFFCPGIFIIPEQGKTEAAFNIKTVIFFL